MALQPYAMLRCCHVLMFSPKMRMFTLYFPLFHAPTMFAGAAAVTSHADRRELARRDAAYDKRVMHCYDICLYYAATIFRDCYAALRLLLR